MRMDDRHTRQDAGGRLAADLLKGASPDEVVRQRLKAEPKLARPHAHSPPNPGIRFRAMRVIHAAKDVSQPDR